MKKRNKLKKVVVKKKVKIKKYNPFEIIDLVSSWAENWDDPYFQMQALGNIKKTAKNSDFSEVELKELVKKEQKKMKEAKKKEKRKKAAKSFTRAGQAAFFDDLQPIHYDSAKLWWLWDDAEKKWRRVDDVDILNIVEDATGLDTANSKVKNEIINALKQRGRRRKPKKPHKTWIQFKDFIVDFSTGEKFEASPEYFIKNPVLWTLGESEDTPTMDKLFREWVVEEGIQNDSWVDTLYEIIAYTICPEQFLQRLIALVGNGANGKGTFIKLLMKFIGESNRVSNEIKELTGNRFGVAPLHAKLLCVMGEISYDDLKNTNILKKLSGEDDISYEFKNKDAFTEKNTCTCIALTNALPTTPDKTYGFYRRWLIVDFPHQFPIKKDIIDEIPEIEFNNLATKCVRILKELSEKGEFTNAGTYEERIKRYEERSNPVLTFLEEKYDEVASNNVPLRDFAKEFNQYAKDKKLRVMTVVQVGKALRNEGFETGKRTNKNGVSSVAILNLQKKTLNPITQNTRTTVNSFSCLHKESNSNLGGFSSSGSQDEELKITYEKI